MDPTYVDQDYSKNILHLIGKKGIRKNSSFNTVSPFSHETSWPI